jgi:hypothetical protein
MQWRSRNLTKSVSNPGPLHNLGAQLKGVSLSLIIFSKLQFTLFYIFIQVSLQTQHKLAGRRWDLLLCRVVLNF